MSNKTECQICGTPIVDSQGEDGDGPSDIHGGCWECLGGDLTDSDTGEHIGSATTEQAQESYLAGPEGHIAIDSDGRVVECDRRSGKEMKVYVADIS